MKPFVKDESTGTQHGNCAEISIYNFRTARLSADDRQIAMPNYAFGYILRFWRRPTAGSAYFSSSIQSSASQNCGYHQALFHAVAQFDTEKRTQTSCGTVKYLFI
ncbi:hypothetical protein [Undibacterium luofuense]|uniref:hypothetical protein n=1 Tax=Undibacterium luofuense TaxID=2828733 RepID=UPI0030EDFA4E